MDNSLFRFEDSYRRPRRRSNLFGWTIAILLLIGFAFAAWLGSFYIFGQPERPDSYRILKKLHKIDPPKRFELTAAPAGEFLNAKQIFDRYNAMRPAELAQVNAELGRNYVRNFQQVRGLVPYVVGRFDVLEAHELDRNDLFTSGMVALTRATDRGELLMEHVYPADAQDLPLMKQTLVPGLEIKLERAHDISAIIHANRLPDGRLLITAIPLLYGRYAVTRGTGTFSLEPPIDLNLAAGWPLFKEPMRRKAEIRYNTYRTRMFPAEGTATAALGSPNLTAPPENELIRVEPALAPEAPKVAAVSPKTESRLPEPAQTPKVNANRKKGATSPTPSISRAPVIAVSTPISAPSLPPATSTVSATPSAESPMVLPALPLTEAENALASTAGGGSWKTFEPGKMPAGRLISTSDLKDVAERGLAGERYYLRGQFVVNFADANRAVLRPRTRLADSVLRFGGSGKSTRIIVEFPAGYSPPAQGSVVNRDEARPYEVTDVRKQADGQLNVFVREIMQR
ncbi:MAG: hypothetical protein ABJB22_01825 [Verrucomicrobiota bacterium]